MKKKKRSMAASLACLSLLGLLTAGCGGNQLTTAQSSEPAQTQSQVLTQATTESRAASTVDAQAGESESVGEQTPETTAATETEGLAKKLTSLDFSDRKVDRSNTAGVSYQDANGTYGFISRDGQTDTGAIYAYMDMNTIDGFAVVSHNESEMTEEIASLNRYGLLSEDGRVVIPEEYAIFEKISDRYIAATKLTEKTTNQDEALVFLKSSLFALQPSEGDPMFKGQWEVFDVKTGAAVPGVTGTKVSYYSDYGDLFQYRDDDNISHTVDASGTEFRSDAQVFRNGSYVLQEPSTATVYNSDGTERFRFDPNEFRVVYKSFIGEGYFAEKNNDGTKSYALLDQDGKIISAEFPSVEGVLGNMIVASESANYMLCAPDGTKLLDPIRRGEEDRVFGRCIILFANSGETNRYLFVDADGNICLDVTEDDTHCVNGYYPYYGAYLKTDTGRLYYSFADGDYTIPGSTVNYWMASVANAGGKQDLIDTFTGETILRGYDAYMIFPGDNGLAVFAAMENTKTYDVYQIGK